VVGVVGSGGWGVDPLRLKARQEDRFAGQAAANTGEVVTGTFRGPQVATLEAIGRVHLRTSRVGNSLARPASLLSNRRALARPAYRLGSSRKRVRTMERSPIEVVSKRR